MSIAEDAGRLFEAGFMMGVIRAVKALLPTPPQDLVEYYVDQRQSYSVARVVEEFAKNSSTQRDALHILGRFYLIKGKLAGYHMLREYIDSILADHEAGFFRQRALKQLELHYWQCSLLAKNRLESDLLPTEEEAQRNTWLRSLKLTTHDILGADSARGGFLNADLLMMFYDPIKDWHHILTVDASAFGPGRRFQDVDFTNGGGLLQMLTTDILYQICRSTFARLAIVAGDPTIPLFDKSLTSYFSAFACTDRETSKVIQAGSYAHGFAHQATINGIINQDRTRFTIIGYSDRGMNSMVLTGPDISLLSDFTEIYKDGKGFYKDEDEALATARDQLLRYIARNVWKLFPTGRDFLKTLRDTQIEKGCINANFEELLEAVTHNPLAGQHYYGTAENIEESVLRQLGLWEQYVEDEKRVAEQGKPFMSDARWAHKHLVKHALISPVRYLFLTGNPGIGKTTAISENINEQCIKEGFLLFYVSPRKAVNRDIIEKFRRKDSSFIPPNFLGIETNHNLINDNGGRPTVKYFGHAASLPEQTRGVHFLNATDAEALIRQHHPSRQRLHRASERAIRDTNVAGAGVLQSISTAIAASINFDRPNAIVAAVAIQSLRMKAKGHDTLEHLFKEMFAFAREGHSATALNEEKMRAMSSTTKHLYFMIDEITGDDSGYKFFDRIANLVATYDLEKYGFNVKIIVADASLAGVPLVKQDLHLRQEDPDSRKIYLSRVPAKSVASLTAPVSSQLFHFDSSDEDPNDAILINSNTFPATQLSLRYRILIPTWLLPSGLSFDEQRRRLSTYQLDKDIDQKIVVDVCDFLRDHPNGDEQAIVYVQNKARLQQIIQDIQKICEREGKEFIADEHYMEIHAEVEPARRSLVEKVDDRDRFLVFFITSSASRGLTFAKARYIFIDVPRFQIESNLMEIIQVIYRGRGGDNDHRQKQLTFYLSDRILLAEDAPRAERDWRRREALLDTFTMLGLLKMCILTRISGATPLDDAWYSVIPLGGKSLAGASHAYHHDLANLSKILKKQLSSQHKHDPHLEKIQSVLLQLLGRCDIQLDPTPGSYLSLYHHADPDIIDQWLKDDGALPSAYVLGGLLIVPTNNVRQHISHHMPLPEAISRAQQLDFRESLDIVSHSQHYIDSLVAGISDLKLLIEELAEVEQMQQLEQAGVESAGYYILPIAMFAAKSSIKAYCQQLSSEGDSVNGEALKEAILHLVRDVFPIDTLLPVGWKYPDFPYLLITSNDLQALRAKTWKTGHMMMTPEMNLLAMLLAKTRESQTS
jgi:hypothetical protein